MQRFKDKHFFITHVKE